MNGQLNGYIDTEGITNETDNFTGNRNDGPFISYDLPMSRERAK